MNRSNRPLADATAATREYRAQALSLDCMGCGACCAYSESWPAFIGEGDAEGIPQDLVDAGHGRMRCHGERCAALVGRIGEHAYCSVYANRPLVCREFQPGSQDCIMVRRSFRLHTP